MVDPNPEQQTDLVGLMVGHRVAVEYLSGRDFTAKDMDEMIKEGRVSGGPPEALTAAFYLRGYSALGIEVAKGSEGGGEFFIPWGAVLAIRCPSREDLERTARRQARQSGPPHDRREIMNQLGSARPPWRWRTPGQRRTTGCPPIPAMATCGWPANGCGRKNRWRTWTSKKVAPPRATRDISNHEED